MHSCVFDVLEWVPFLAGSVKGQMNLLFICITAAVSVVFNDFSD